MAEKEIVRTERAPAPFEGAPYNPAVKVAGLVFVAGQLGLAPDGSGMVSGGIAEQTEQALQNLSAILVEAGSSLDRLAKTTVFLQSLDEPQLCFLMLPVLVIDPSYRLHVSPDDLLALELDPARQPEIGTDVMCMAIVAIAEQGHPTANLLAPLVVNPATGRAVQAIRDDGAYGCRHPLMTETRETPCS